MNFFLLPHLEKTVSLLTYLNRSLFIFIDDTGYNSHLSISFQSQETEKPTISSTRFLKKTKKIRTAFTDDQKQYLDHFYSINRYPDPTQMEKLSCLLSLDEKVIRVWFQNKRSREKTHLRNDLINFRLS